MFKKPLLVYIGLIDYDDDDGGHVRRVQLTIKGFE